MKSVTDVLRSIRIVEKLTQKEFAERLGLKQSTYTMIESGKNNASIDLLRTISKVFNVNPSIFFSSTNDSIIDDINNTNNDYLNHDKKGYLNLGILDKSEGVTLALIDDIGAVELNNALIKLVNSQFLYLEFHLSDVLLNLKLLQENLTKRSFDRDEYKESQKRIAEIVKDLKTTMKTDLLSNKSLIEGLLQFDEGIRFYLDNIRDISKELHLHNSK